jgi:hypothetical protein
LNGWEISIFIVPVSESDDKDFQTGGLNEKFLIFFAEFTESRNFLRPHFDDVYARCE